MTEHRPYPPIRAEEDLDDLPMVAYLETAGRRHQIRLEEGDDPVEVAGRFLERAPAENRFNLVTIQRFSLSVLPEPHIGPQCGAMDATENGVVRCELEAHSDGVHDAAVLLRDGAPAGVRYWSGKTTTGVAHDCGFAYVVLNVGGVRVHVIGTHTQSTDSGCGAGEAVRDRSRQFKAIDAFLDAKRISADEEVLVAGDLNVDSRGAEYASMLADADLAAADARTGHPYSFDTQENSIAHDRYPGDPREDLDHVLARAGNARPARWRNEVVEERSAPWTVSSWGTSYTYTDLSDHYPVRAYAG